MDLGPVVLDISSDDESFDRRDDPKGVDFAWLAEFLEKAESSSNDYRDGYDDDDDDDDDDEVVVLREVKGLAKSKSLKPGVRDGVGGGSDDDDDDGDCVVLDGDPDKPLADESSSKDDCEELLIVAEKGQVACRDFPHPRHLCVSFSFSITPHEKYCSLCHCYVCDKPAPCALWETTSSDIDHCHATEKEETWQTQRRNLKLGKIAPPPPTLPALKSPESLVTPGLPQPLHNPNPPHNIVYMPPSSILSRRPVIQGCSSTNFSTPTILSRSRNPQLGAGLPKNILQPYIVSDPVPHNNMHGAKGNRPLNNSGHRIVPPNPALFKRPGVHRFPRAVSIGASSPMNHSTFNLPILRNHAPPLPYPRNPTPPPVLYPRNPTPPPGQFLRNPTPPPGPYSRNPTPPVPYHRNPTPSPLSNLNQTRWQNVNSSLHQSSSRPHMRPTALNTASPSQPLLPPRPSPPPVGNQNFYRPENQFQNSGLSIYQQGTGTPNTGQTVSPIDVPNAGARTLGPTDYNPSWVMDALDNSGQSSQQQPSLVDHVQLQGTEPSNDSTAKESTSKLSITNTIHSSDIDDWLLENPTVSEVQAGSSIPQLDNMYSPESNSVDIGTLFDPWDGLTHA